MITLRELAELIGGTAVGDASREIAGVRAPDRADPGYLCLAWKEGVFASLPADIPVLTASGGLAGGERDGIEARDPRAALVKILAVFDTRLPDAPGIDANAFVAPTAIVDPSAHVGPFCVVSDGASIGPGTVLQANVFVGRGVTIGRNSRVEASSAVHDGCKIGDNVIIHSCVVIGSDGFGFVTEDGGRRVKIPQIGTVEVEDDVEIGANSAVDCATFGVTTIARGVKIGNHVQIAHNTRIGENTILVGSSAFGGSMTIGRDSLVAGMVGVADHIDIGERVTIAGRAGVTKDVPDGMTISGFPAQDHREEWRFQASLRRVRHMAEQIKALEKRIALLEGHK